MAILVLSYYSWLYLQYRGQVRVLLQIASDMLEVEAGTCELEATYQDPVSRTESMEADIEN